MIVCYIPGRRQRGDEKKSKAQQTPKLPPTPQVNWDMRLCPKSDFQAQAPTRLKFGFQFKFLLMSSPSFGRIEDNWTCLLVINCINPVLSSKKRKRQKINFARHILSSIIYDYYSIVSIWIQIRVNFKEWSSSSLELKTISSSSLLPPPFSRSGGNPRG